MRQSAIRISESYVVPDAQRKALDTARHRYGAAQVAPDELGGWFDYLDWKGRPVSVDYFLGRWTLMYFGYARCSGTCRAVAPILADAAEALRTDGYAARAAFVDIETHPVNRAQMIDRAAVRHLHDYNWPMRQAQARQYREHGGKLDVLGGTRAQLAQATAAFHVLREHVPPKAGEEGHAINHSSMIYVVGPDTYVAAYGYHDMGASELVGLVRQLAVAERKTVDFAAVRARYVRFSCGGEA